MAPRAAFFVVLAAGSAACTAILGDLPDDSVLVAEDVQLGGWPDRPTTDAGPFDGSSTGGETGVSPSGYCAAFAKATFCRDFEDGVPFYQGFQYHAADGCSLTLSSDASVSPPNSVVTECTASPTDPYAEMDQQFDIRASDISLSFDIQVAAGTDQGWASVIGFGTQFGQAGEHDLWLRVTSARATITEIVGTGPNGPPYNYYEYPLAHGFTLGQWAHVDMHLANSQVTVKIGNDVIAPNLNQPWNPGAITFTVGMLYAQSGYAWRIFFDNVVLDLHP